MTTLYTPTHCSPEDFISIKDLRKNFDTLEVLKGVNLSISKGEIVSIVGPSGAGKTTLLQILGTLDAPTSGEVWINGINPHTLPEKKQALFRNRKIGFVFQFHELLPEFSAQENIAIPAMLAGVKHKEAMKDAEEMLIRMGLKERLKHKPRELSGGEKQRVAVARALINRPDVLLADEPSGSLDSNNKEELHQLFFQLREELQQTIVIVTHDEHLSHLTDRRIELVDGTIVSITSSLHEL
ncbi:ABC transporter ATP-binding protein [Porphyromonas circumdentaria]|uniref:Lipoprotein-releasing system ATP-binding protein n=1 Tax=Porphyromonas circumdentaria TaxID=29524 RepID=A0A1T4M5R8_9PORP|nr:ABC transporter ATP-binding protein [Porphyromonas circumdentaria]MBB6275559.1 lipoprotein-releasing system ATP-binding protein [Porphyromonas circumdentaria]MDO4722145.1 ABC transporter ATP-binding protein [Porphyromonas circumdentaria]SJZ62251.1 lipoprotein-releasing system ATP-binding protein [Porphyromonas circumdentaria]